MRLMHLPCLPAPSRAARQRLAAIVCLGLFLAEQLVAF